MASQRTPTDLSGLNPETLRSLVDVPFDPSGLTAQQEAVWLDVIAKMEQVYTDLLEDEIELIASSEGGSKPASHWDKLIAHVREGAWKGEAETGWSWI